MSIDFYSMPGCGFCQRAEELFSTELGNGTMVKKPSSEAKGVTGFPHFTFNEKTHTGLPSSKAELYTKLDFNVENYQRMSFDWVGVL